MLKNDLNKRIENAVRTKKYSNESIRSVSDRNLTTINDVTTMISKLEKIVKDLEDEVCNLKQNMHKKIN